MASSELWTKENRITKMEDIEKAPFYDELLFEIKSRADIEPLIAAKEAKYKSDDLKINLKGQEKNKEINLKKIERIETKLNTIETLEKHIICVYNYVTDIFSLYSKKKQENLVSLFSGYAQNGTFSVFNLQRVMTEPNGILSSIMEGKKIKLANSKLNEFMEFCKQNDIYQAIKLDSTATTREFFEEIMSGKNINIATYSAQVESFKSKLINEIENTHNEIKKAEHSIKLANDGFERDNYVLIDLENSIIREYAKNITAKLFPEEIKPAPKPEPKTQEPVALSKEEKKQKEAKTSKITDMLGKVKAPDWNGLKEKTLDKFKTIKNPFKK